MSNPVDLLSDRELVVVTALQPLAQRAADMMPVEIPLADEDEAVFEAARTSARSVLAALDARPPEPRRAGPLNGSDANALRLDLDAESLVIVAQDRHGGAAVAVSLLAAGSGTLDEGHARAVAADVARALVRRIVVGAGALTRRATAFVGRLVYATPRDPGETMLLHVELPRGEFAAVVEGLGAPQRCPSVAVIACPEPEHPAREVDALTLGAVRLLNDLLASGEPRLVPELLHEVGRLGATIGAIGAIRRRDLTAPPPAQPEAP